ncbi:hypothetical protein Cgig2_017090 [Carnegiea gigantea]|uniref:Uncharacterized protein n=1 Tax=Carnegiea gigantea TaxID=171969 RepID=A0A9Q1QBK8_9CARY|nr:hypothetical protein Cgig2_017090 [Carnegiea gigantea]
MEVEASTFLANQRRQFSLSKPVLNSTHYSPATHPSLQPPAYSQSYNSAPSNRRTNGQRNYYRRLGHTIDKCSKLQRLRNQSNQDKRMAASMQHSDSCSTYNDAASNKSSGHHTLIAEQYEQVLTLLSKQNMEITTNVPSQHTGYSNETVTNPATLGHLLCIKKHILAPLHL